MIRRLVILAAALLAWAAPVAAQQLQPGTRVRVTVPSAAGEARLIGTVVGGDDSRIRLRLDGADPLAPSTVSISRSVVRRVEVSLGNALRKPATRTGAIAGLVAGVGIGFALSGRDGHRSAWGTAMWTAPAMAAVGAGTGAFLGHGPNEQWRTVMPSPQPTGLALGHNVSVSIRLGF